MNDPSKRVTRILQEVRECGGISEVAPDLFAILANNAQSLVEEVERLRK